MDVILGEVLTLIRPLRNDWIVRAQIIGELRSVVESVESLRGRQLLQFVFIFQDLFSF